MEDQQQYPPAKPYESPETETSQPVESQEQATQDSGLQTSQPDQPVPTESEREEPEPREAPRGVQRPPARDQVAEEATRQQELAVQRQEHNDRTGGGKVPGASDGVHDTQDQE